MSRSIVVPGETMVYLRFGAHLSGQFGATAANPYVELGLMADGVQVTPSLYYDDVKVDDFGLRVPCDLQAQMSHATVAGSLLHYDKEVIDAALLESMGGARRNPNPDAPLALVPGRVAPAGQLMAGRKSMYWSGNHFFSVVLAPMNYGFGPRFIQCHLTDPSALVTKYAANAEPVHVSFRALPYWEPVFSGGSITNPAVIVHEGVRYTRKKEVQSSGVYVWDYEPIVNLLQ